MRSLTLKLMLAFLLISLTGAALAAAFARWATLQEFDLLRVDRAQSEFVADVTAYYQSNKSWAGVAAYIRQKRQTLPQPPLPGNPSQIQPPPESFSLVDPNGVVLVPARQYHPGDRVSAAELQKGTPVESDGKVIGTVLPTGQIPELDPRDVRYLERTNQASIISALGASVIALLLSLVLARTLTHPVRDLTRAIRAMAEGKLDQQVAVRSRDELGELSAAFNQMSADLARANQLRRQMTADIAHDLRTPLTVIGGYIESLRDGMLKPTPARLDAMYQEVQHLKRLVDDLRTLSLADAGELKLNRHRISPQALLEQSIGAFKHQAEEQRIDLHLQIDSELPEINVDPGRMAQVLGNVISNALRYTPKGGQIVLSTRRHAAAIVLAVADNGAGIAPDVLPHIFERSFRGDVARKQNDAESGLGLAIAKSIVELHGGKITAESAGIGHGSTFSILLPL